MIEKIKAHVERHKVAYSCGITAVIAAGITCIIMRERHAVLKTGADGPDVATVHSLSFNFLTKESGNVTTTISRDGRGNPGYITRWMEGNVDYETQGLAASEQGVKPSIMSAHIKGIIPDINGQHFERVGV